MGTIKKIQQSPRGMELFIVAPHILRRVKAGSSVAVNGVCLTVASKTSRLLKFIVMQETLKCTTLAHARAGTKVGLEPSLRAGEEIGGHFVYGHIDGRARVMELKKASGSLVMTLSATKDLLKYMIMKGTIAIDGVSLTIMRLSRGTFAVSLLRQTLDLTSLGEKRERDEVNIEVDMINKFLMERCAPK
ncbi:MAG: Riboflavin synthase, alpha subunit [Candidatus Magasanikbacteria bacterium GW2011_GWA2_45_39]|uniref:Riboflavin synthase n=2 Tax=Candidatus Magasanikiibacteriota TaxID=1752731 RepID=A0A0G1MZ37_9BACT|nr:MAG: Riboflavin synthase, alpha subunit [Candidatus Magasanikbacteria bacterium GW2011_GWA2_45_39]KKU13606.1 MAG: Riboflavin synthase, alpha subunit [Candidatus Magasanikbacteria bacterium GW2011_GWC2_45_8]